MSRDAAVVRRSSYPVTPDRLWRQMTEPDRVAGWMGGRMEWELVEGAPLRFTDDEGMVFEGRVEQVDVERELRWTWWPAGRQSVSEVSWVLEPDGAGTELTVTEAPVEAPATADAEARAWTGDDDRSLAAWAAASLVVA